MIRVTIWYEHVQELGGDYAKEMVKQFTPDPAAQERILKFFLDGVQEIKAVHPNGLHNTLKDIFTPCEDMTVTAVTLDMPECGLPDELLNNTDVLIWWGHMAHDQVPDELAEKVRMRVLKGMGFIALHSAHPCKPLCKLLGTSGALKWREGDFSRVWNVCPAHPIAQGIPEYFELPEEEMYGEPFDVAKPDDLVFISWFRGGEVFRSGLTWTRGYGKIFYFQPGHETNKAYYNEYVRKILINAVRWAAPGKTIEEIVMPHVPVSPEAKCREEKA